MTLSNRQLSTSRAFSEYIDDEYFWNCNDETFSGIAEKNMSGDIYASSSRTTIDRLKFRHGLLAIVDNICWKSLRQKLNDVDSNGKHVSLLMSCRLLVTEIFWQYAYACLYSISIYAFSSNDTSPPNMFIASIGYADEMHYSYAASTSKSSTSCWSRSLPR